MPVNLRKKARPGVAVQQIHEDQNINCKNGPMTRNKRRSNGSPQLAAPSRKRAAFGDITNALQSIQDFNKGKKDKAPLKPPRAPQVTKKAEEQKKDVVRVEQEDCTRVEQEDCTRVEQEDCTRVEQEDCTRVEQEDCTRVEQEDCTRVEQEDIMMLSPELESLSDSSPTEMQVEELNQINLQKNAEVDIKEKVAAIRLEETASTTCPTSTVDTKETIMEAELMEEIINIDEENKDDPNQSPEYAFEIFKYLKEREPSFRISNYFETQPEITQHMRAILMDWMVEVQENFELNHETLYLAAKLVDLYLSNVQIKKDILQLVGATSLFISCKFDERCPPALEDFMYICDDAYNRHQFIRMEQNILKSIDFDLGIPLSYRFLRRYAKCVHASMETLTLARFILELSLMEHDIMTTSDSKLGAATLLLAFKMKNSGGWNATLVHHSGYKAEDLSSLVSSLNAMLKKPSTKQLQTVRTKYSHRIFYEVAKIQPLDVLQL